jgi:branched-chain amino acid transport system substrate-binding protein
VEVVILDHRGSTPRFKKHLKKFLKDEEALVMYSGLHSPPLLSQKKFISENEIVMLDPWAAAGPITRYNSKDNYIFRLSVDDSKAGKVIAKNAITNEKFKKPYLLLENTGWGKSNKKTMTNALNSLNIGTPYLKFFNWNISKTEAKIILKNIIQSGSDVIFLVANAKEGKVFAKAMSELPKNERIPIRSHWGITGGDFPKVITSKIRDKIDLQFIQTSFSFMNKNLSKNSKEVFDKLKMVYPEIKTYKDLKAPVGFIHAYDLTLILQAALDQITLTNDIKENRRLLKNSLENIKKPVKGLIKTYKKPFSVFNKNNIDAHEALNENDFVMAEYGENNEILLKK